MRLEPRTCRMENESTYPSVKARGTRTWILKALEFAFLHIMVNTALVTSKTSYLLPTSGLEAAMLEAVASRHTRVKKKTSTPLLPPQLDAVGVTCAFKSSCLICDYHITYPIRMRLKVYTTLTESGWEGAVVGCCPFFQHLCKVPRQPASTAGSIPLVVSK